MKHISRKHFAILLVSIIALLSVTVGGTLAYLATQTDPVINEFKPSRVACAVVENGQEPIAGGQVAVTQKSNVQIKNTGDTDAYIRAAVVVTWKNTDGEVYAAVPVESMDYEIDWNLSDDGWVKGNDGFFYYVNEVAPCSHAESQIHTGCMTGILIDSCSPVDGKAPDGYFLSVEIVASAIQSAPEMVVEEQWSTSVSDANNGKLTIQEGETT